MMRAVILNELRRQMDMGNHTDAPFVRDMDGRGAVKLDGVFDIEALAKAVDAAHHSATCQG